MWQRYSWATASVPAAARRANSASTAAGAKRYRLPARRQGTRPASASARSQRQGTPSRRDIRASERTSSFIVDHPRRSVADCKQSSSTKSIERRLCARRAPTRAFSRRGRIFSCVALQSRPAFVVFRRLRPVGLEAGMFPWFGRRQSYCAKLGGPETRDQIDFD